MGGDRAHQEGVAVGGSLCNGLRRNHPACAWAQFHNHGLSKGLLEFLRDHP